jgi:hypothetical protein
MRSFETCHFGCSETGSCRENLKGKQWQNSYHENIINKIILIIEFSLRILEICLLKY